MFSTVNEEPTLKICHFHHPYVDYRVEMPRTDTVDEAEYEACREQGAMIVTAHDHIYARTKLMSNYAKNTVAHPESSDDAFILIPGTSFSVISGASIHSKSYTLGLGGKSTVKLSPELVKNPWWVSIWPGDGVATRNSEVGALICSVPTKPNYGIVDCKFESGKGEIVDRFSFTTDYEK